MRTRVLFVDDDDTFRGVLTRELEAVGYDVASCASAEEALRALSSSGAEVGLFDLRLPGMDGLGLLEAALAQDPELSVVVLTGHGSVSEAVEAMRRGAFDFLEKPTALGILEQTLQRAVRHRELQLENQRLRELVRAEGGTEILGESPAARELRATIAKMAASSASVLVVGENGTGKELVARALHEDGPRREHPFVVVNCGAIPNNLVESELFGHERGSFTGADRKRLGLFEAAHGGTLFLDEIGELPLSVQPALLRALQFGEIRPVGSERARSVDARIVAASNRDLLAEVEAGNFREDLYYRLSALLVHVPPLRERREDVELLARFLLERQNHELPPARRLELDPAALEALSAHDWPGNVRELENAVTRLATLVETRRITARDVERHVLDRRRHASGELPTLDVEELERMAILKALQIHRGNRKRAAAELGIAVKTLYNKIRRYDVSPEELSG